jgi:hypothetical protein
MTATGYAHDALVRLDPGGDPRAPGGAITEALCGSVDHPAPCPVAAHYTGAEPDRGDLRLRVLFATEPERADGVRSSIERALRQGRFTGPDGVVTGWRLLRAAPGELAADERDHAARLARSVAP